MEAFLALYDNKIKKRNKRIQKWTEQYHLQKEFELKMVSFLALVDHKIRQKMDKSEKPFRRSRSAARTLAMKRQVEMGEISNASKVQSRVIQQMPVHSLVFPYQSEFHQI